MPLDTKFETTQLFTKKACKFQKSASFFNCRVARFELTTLARSAPRDTGLRLVKRKSLEFLQGFFYVGVARFELTTSWSQTKRDTGLRYTPNIVFIIRSAKIHFIFS
jgi:hypothetical protein